MKAKSYKITLENLDYFMEEIQELSSYSDAFNCWSKMYTSESDPGVVIKLQKLGYSVGTLQFVIPLKFLSTLVLKKFEFGGDLWNAFIVEPDGKFSRTRLSTKAGFRIKTGQRQLPNDSRELTAITYNVVRLRGILKDIVDGRSSSVDLIPNYKRISGVII